MRREVFEKSTVLNEFEKLKKEEDYLEKELDRQKRSLLALESTPTNEETISTVEEGVGLENPSVPTAPRLFFSDYCWDSSRVSE